MVSGLVMAVVVFSVARFATRHVTPRSEPAPAAGAEPRLAEADADGGSGDGSAPRAEARQEGGAGVSARSRTDPPREASSPAAAAAVQELRAMSESYRNTSLLVAIRDAGFMCTEVVAVSAGAGEVGGWRVSCRDATAYWLGVDDSGRLRVDPVFYGDGGPGPIAQPRPQPQDGPAEPLQER
jgi:hypothetical protein